MKVFEFVTHPIPMNSTTIESQCVVSPGATPVFSVNTGIPNEQLPGAECSVYPHCSSEPSDVIGRSRDTHGPRAHSCSEPSAPEARTEQSVDWMTSSPCYHGNKTGDKTNTLFKGSEHCSPRLRSIPDEASAGSCKESKQIAA